MTAPPGQHDRILAGWLEQLERVLGELREARLYRTVWDEFRLEVIEKRPDADGTFLYVMSRMYASTQLSLIRRLVDGDDSTASLVNLIEGIKRNPNVMTLRRYVDMAGDDRRRAASNWASRYGSSETVPAGALAADLEKVISVTGDLKAWVDKRIAHMDRGQPAVATPKFGEIDGALEVLEQIASRYQELLTQSTTVWDLIALGDWHGIFRPVLFPLDPRVWDWQHPNGFT